jgi:hypothetical protein
VTTPVLVPELLSTVVDDPDVRGAVKSLALEALGEARRLLRVGTPPVRARVMATVLPILVKSIGPASDTSNDDLRSEMEAMFAEMRAG